MKDQQERRRINRFSSAGGGRIYRIPIESFRDHFTNVYLVIVGERICLIDLGSGWRRSNEELVEGIASVRERFGEPVSIESIDLLLITHGHIDHFGGLSFFCDRSKAKVGIHALDARQVINFEEAIMMVARDVRIFLETTGVSEKTRKAMMDMYTASKNALRSVAVDFFLDERSDPVEGLFRVHHTPGHCPGEVCIQLDDVLFTGDHVLSRITPHQSPEVIARYTGLGHYLDSLEKIKALPGIRLALGGHEGAIDGLYDRIEAMQDFHVRRLERILEICREPRTIKEISAVLFDELSGYKILLALEEAAAHVEYLHQRGRLAIDNLDDLGREANPVLHYRTR